MIHVNRLVLGIIIYSVVGLIAYMIAVAPRIFGVLAIVFLVLAGAYVIGALIVDE